MHLPAGISGVRVRQEAETETCDPQARHVRARGAGREFPRPQRQAARGGAHGVVTPPLPASAPGEGGPFHGVLSEEHRPQIPRPRGGQSGPEAGQPGPQRADGLRRALRAPSGDRRGAQRPPPGPGQGGGPPCPEGVPHGPPGVRVHGVFDGGAAAVLRPAEHHLPEHRVHEVGDQDPGGGAGGPADPVRADLRPLRREGGRHGRRDAPAQREPDHLYQPPRRGPGDGLPGQALPLRGVLPGSGYPVPAGIISRRERIFEKTEIVPPLRRADARCGSGGHPPAPFLNPRPGAAV